ncbi:MAG: hypothetical protein GWP08_20130 [Nitrospiraceae bacterium]|nr:hypothetical protein [Nitrospiraceae bacterium]
MVRTIKELVGRLAKCPNVTGLVRYGGRHVEDMSPGGDFDLFVIVNDRPKGLEGMHFHVGGVPIDVSMRTLDDLHSESPLTRIDIHLASGEVLVDKTGRLQELLPPLAQRWQASLPEAGPNDQAAARFHQSHALNKVRGRIDSEPLLCHFLIATDVFWLVQSYFSVRRLAYPGEKPALEVIRTSAPAIFRLIENFYAETELRTKLAILEDMTDRILEPIGGTWKQAEVLSLAEEGYPEDIQPRGRAFLAHILDMQERDLV